MCADFFMLESTRTAQASAKYRFKFDSVFSPKLHFWPAIVDVVVTWPSCLWPLHSFDTVSATYRVGQKNWGHIFFTACDFRNIDKICIKFGKIKVISVLTLNHNLFEPSLENKVAPSSEWLRK